MQGSCEPVRRPGRKPRLPLRAGCFCLIMLLVGACGGPPATPEEEIRELIGVAAEAAEQGEAEGVARALHPDYKDMRGNGREDLLRMLRLALLRDGRVLVVPHIESVELHGRDAASVTMTVRFAEADLATLSLDAGARRVELEMVKEDVWRVISARWSRPDAPPR